MNELNHVAIIMDGNGRWAESKNKARREGHKAGAMTVKKITTVASKIGIKYLTLYAFSTENWSRPGVEIAFLMKLLKKFLKDELDTLVKNNIKFKAIGDLSKFDVGLQKLIKDVEDKTKNNFALTQILALNYGSKDELVRTCKKLQDKNIDITHENIEKNLDTKDISHVDLLIRTGGEKRLSNFLLWQSAYAELFFTNTFWPDFSENEFKDIIQQFLHVKRKFGGL